MFQENTLHANGVGKVKKGWSKMKTIFWTVIWLGIFFLVASGVVNFVVNMM